MKKKQEIRCRRNAERGYHTDKIQEQEISGGLFFCRWTWFCRQPCFRICYKKDGKVTAIKLSKNPQLIDHPGFRSISADTTKAGKRQEEVRN
jgi:hypothetical protein